MENSNKHIWFGLGGVVLGILLSLVITQSGLGFMKDGGKQTAQRTETKKQIDPNDHMHSAMQGMMMGLDNLTGAEFDKAFIDQMIIHHDGAIDMAEAALENAERQEIKDLAREIISAQTREIEQMKAWKMEWYK
ncbi:TPA: hypothetical protein DCG61_00675 [Patescibacteria group bacterium]|jgi:uncharacterized protein (DUF305 family)|nr:hypothetical protein [Patescibacteria group bacterium]